GEKKGDDKSKSGKEGGGPGELETAGGAFPASELYKEIGANLEQWDIYRNSIALIESQGKYGIPGGSGMHFDGRYQMGEDAKKDGSAVAGVPNPGHSDDPNAHVRVSFRNNPQLQETIFTGFTIANHRYLMKNPKYKSASVERKLQILGYAHNQGMGGAENWLNTGKVGVDGFQTKGTAYTDLIAKNFRSKKSGGVMELATGAVPVPTGDETELSGKAGKIIAGAKKILGLGKGVVNECAKTVRAALVAGGLSEFKSKTTQIGDLDSDPNAGRNVPELAASFGGSDLGRVIRNKSNIKAGDIILWRGGGGYGPGAITHVGIAADDGLKNQYDHNTGYGFHYRPHWDSASGRKWFAGVRLMSEGGMIKRPSLAIIAERGKEEFLLGGRTTELFNSLNPNLLEKINAAKTK
ncbi:hypothetical protein EBQ91_00350, partial [bacterium]|nr:hypothetical protein [bacterium]